MVPRATDVEELLALARRAEWQRDPFRYITERLGVRPETIDWAMLKEYRTHKWDGTPNPLKKILAAIAAGKWVGVESGVGCGKTFLAACIALWFWECFPDSVVVTIAPKAEQLSLHVWKEIGRLHPKLGIGDLSNLKLRMIPMKEQWIIVGFVAGVKSEEAEASATKAQGFHAKDMLIICEETPGIAPAVMRAFQNTCTAPHNLILALGNPDHAKDQLHEFCKLPRVEHVRISGFDHPNVVLDNPEFVAGAQSRLGLQTLKERYRDETNPLYMSRARGISPEQSVNSLIRLEWCYEARDRVRTEEMYEGGKALGVDVANSESGDKAAIAEGTGRVLERVEDFQCPDANQLGHKIHARIIAERIDPTRVGIDGIGVGAGTVNALKEDGSFVTNLLSAEPAEPTYDEHGNMQEERYANLRAQMWWQMRMDLQAGRICLPDDEELYADLVTPQWFVRNGKITIEKKEELKKRLGRSPNKGDAAVYWNWVRNTRGGVGVAVSETKMNAERFDMADAYKAQRKRTW